MIEMNGPEATKLIRNLGYKGVIIGLTGNEMSKDIVTFLDSGVNGVLIKPLNIFLFMKTFESYYRALDVVDVSSLSRARELEQQQLQVCYRSTFIICKHCTSSNDIIFSKLLNTVLITTFAFISAKKQRLRRYQFHCFRR